MLHVVAHSQLGSLIHEKVLPESSHRSIVDSVFGFFPSQIFVTEMLSNSLAN